MKNFKEMVYKNLFEVKTKGKSEPKPDFLDLDKDGDTEEAEKTEKGEDLEDDEE